MVHVTHAGPYGELSEQFLCVRRILHEQFPYHCWTWVGGKKESRDSGYLGKRKEKKKTNFNNELSVNVGISPKYIEIKFYFLNLLTFMGDLG